MDINNRIDKIKTEVHGKIEHAAKKGDSKVILSLTNILQSIKTVDENLNHLNNLIHNIEMELLNIEQNDKIKDNYAVLESYHETTSRSNGERRRKEFVAKIRNEGFDIYQMKGTLFESNTLGRIGIAWASERNNNRWWLGLPDKDFDFVVLLCENKLNVVNTFILSKEFYTKYSSMLSRNNGQLKFIIVSKNDSYLLNIPQKEPVRINHYFNNYELLFQQKKLNENKRHSKKNESFDEFRIILSGIEKQKEWGIIRFPKGLRRKLPGFKNEFTIITDEDTFTSHVSSAPKGTRMGDPEAGTYICGNLKPWYRRHPYMIEGQLIRFQVIESMKKYKLEIL